MSQLPEMVELSGAELDAVTGGAQGNGVANAFGNLIGVAAGVGVAVDSVSVLDNNTVQISLLDNSQIQVPIGVAVAILGAAGSHVSANQLRRA